ncbi:MAG: zinc-ribbon domain-containing protein [Acidobacteria bacterium]|nr:zinc-ribbon domain-containing protein [Acidobacteriota bacterium]
MIIECAHCATRYNYDESKFGDQPSKKIRCAKCKEVFEIHNPKLTGSSAPSPAADTHDETFVRRGRREAASTTEETNARVAMSDPKMPDNVRLSLAITEGPGAAQVFRIERPVVTIGRADADIVLPDQESSRQHAELSVRDGHYFLRDLDSRNGTWIEGQKIEGEVEIYNQSEFRVGATTLMLIVTSVD